MDEMPPADIIELLDDLYDEAGQEIWIREWSVSDVNRRKILERSVRMFSDGGYM